MPSELKQPAASQSEHFLRERWEGSVVVSYAQNAEDVRLWRVFASKGAGFYVDIGAGHPVSGSVTKLFYDAGWSGINVEPGPDFELLVSQRPRDRNLRIAIASSTGHAEMWFTFPSSGLSSLIRPEDDRLPAEFTLTSGTVQTARLDDVLNECAHGRQIDFLKIDVEGAERSVLESFDVNVFRPTVVIVEAIAQLGFEPTHHHWEALLLGNGYVHAAFDGINRFYVTEEHEDLIPALDYPVSVLDRFVLHDAVWRRDSSLPTPYDAGSQVNRVPYERIRTLEAEAREAKHELEAIRRTLSWRITRPLRAARVLQRRARALRAPPSEILTERTESGPLEEACAERIFQVAQLLGGDDIPPTRGVLPSLDEALGHFERAIETSVAPMEAKAWLALTATDGRYPTDEMVRAIARLTRTSETGSLSSFLRQRLEQAITTGIAPSERLDIVRGTVVVPVEAMVGTDIHTGIQRVARESISRWLETKPAFELAYFKTRQGGLALLAPAEHERLRAWRRHLSESGSPISLREPQLATGNVLVPWRCRLAVPELLLNRDHSRALATLATSRVVDSLSFISFDLIPIVAPETVEEGLTAQFCDYLATVKHADRVSAISRQSARSFTAYATLLESEGLVGPRVAAHPLPTEMPLLRERELADGLHSLELSGLPLVLVVGVHVPRKNHLAVLEAAERLWRNGHGFELMFVGGLDRTSGNEFDRYARHLRESGWPVRVIRRASEAELWAAYRAARFTVYPSLLEGYGLPVAESLVCGTPAITSEYGAMAEVAEGGGALLVDPRNVDQLEEQMRRLLRDDELLERLRAEARGRDFGTWDRYAKDVWEFLVGDEPDAI